ncbi:hypothetical protein PoB_005244900 [Plakobranchus ocellatus]|uniref:Uncharacterized protein n=1 Tax=Plakobranchus ocellatus TaxID=259542 RepID=A0AAV4C488_9GAST|nr:hypothetical protein PoB_005244900 [Plakobranchus ocellatus]
MTFTIANEFGGFFVFVLTFLLSSLDLTFSHHAIHPPRPHPAASSLSSLLSNTPQRFAIYLSYHISPPPHSASMLPGNISLCPYTPPHLPPHFSDPIFPPNQALALRTHAALKRDEDPKSRLCLLKISTRE